MGSPPVWGERWRAVADGVWVLRNRVLDLNLGLVLGTAAHLVVDTGIGARHGALLTAGAAERAAVGTTHVVLTHAHFDHVFGTAALPHRAAVYAHPVCAATLAGHQDRGPWAELLATEGFPAWVPELHAATLVQPDVLVADTATVDLGGREVRIVHPGRGHTGGDLVVQVPDAGVVFAGDLVEQGAPPQAGEDAHPGEWPATLDRLLALRPRVVVPGHGEPVDAVFVAAQRDQLAV